MPEQAQERSRAYYRHNRAKVLKRTRAYYLEHQDEYARYRVDWYAKHPDFSKSEHYKVKLKAMQAVSKRPDPVCVNCGCDDLRFLEINHKKGGGAKEYQTAGSNFYWDIVKNRRPTDDLEITCGPHNRWHFYRLKYGEVADRFQIVWK